MVLEDERHINSPLCIAALNFLALCLCEEGKMRPEAAVHDQPARCIVHLLDRRAADGQCSKHKLL